MRLRQSPDEDAIALADLLRRLQQRGVDWQLINIGGGEFYLLRSDRSRRVVPLPQQVPGEVIRDIADAFDLDYVALYFDRIERDSH